MQPDTVRSGEPNGTLVKTQPKIRIIAIVVFFWFCIFSNFDYRIKHARAVCTFEHYGSRNIESAREDRIDGETQLTNKVLKEYNSVVSRCLIMRCPIFFASSAIRCVHLVCEFERHLREKPPFNSTYSADMALSIVRIWR